MLPSENPAGCKHRAKYIPFPGDLLSFLVCVCYVIGHSLLSRPEFIVKSENESDIKAGEGEIIRNIM